MMIPRFQICIDADDPHLLNRFWAAAVGYVAEDHHDQVTELLAAGHVTPEDTVEIDGRLAFATAAASRIRPASDRGCCSSTCPNRRRSRTASTSTSSATSTPPAARSRSSG